MLGVHFGTSEETHITLMLHQRWPKQLSLYSDPSHGGLFVFNNAFEQDVWMRTHVICLCLDDPTKSCDMLCTRFPHKDGLSNRQFIQILHTVF